MPRIFALIALIAWIWLLWPYHIAAFMAACIACVSLPFYKKLRERYSAYMTLGIYTTLLVLVTVLPVLVVVGLVTPQAVAGMRTLERLRNHDFLESPVFQAWFSTIDNWLKDFPGLEGGVRQLASYAADMAGTAVGMVLSGGVGIAGGVFQLLVNMFLFILITLMCVVNADIIFEFTQRVTNFSKEMLTRFVVALRNAIFGILMGVVFVAMIQGVLCGIGFFVADVPQSAFWGLIATLVAPIPFIGTMLVWGPICIWLWLSKAPLAALGVFIWATLVVTGVDSVMRPLFLRAGINASVVALVLAIICGLATFGPVGIFAGPVLVALAIQAAYESTVGALAEQQIEEGSLADGLAEKILIDESIFGVLAEQIPVDESTEKNIPDQTSLDTR